MSATLPRPNAIDAASAIAPRVISPPLAVRARNWLPASLLAIFFLISAIDLNLNPLRLLEWSEIAGKMLSGLFRPSQGGQLGDMLKGLAETFAMAVAGTFIAVSLAFPLGFIGSKTLISNPIAHGVIRLSYNLFRGIPSLIWAVLLIRAFGLGPMAGVLAIAFAESPYIAKLFAEIIENAERGPMTAMRAAGAGPAQTLRYGLIPQVMPNFVSLSLFLLEVNVRAAAALGLVGAGGIGHMLSQRVDFFAFDEVAFILLLLLVLVACVDFISGLLRRQLVGVRAFTIGSMS